MLQAFAIWLKNMIFWMGYPGIIILMAVESSFIPFPSEIVVPPAGYLAFQGEMSLWLVILCGLTGSMLGAYVNYAIAVFAGRPFIIKYGRYFLITEEKMQWCESFFEKHGEITTFVCRLIPGVRQLISFPAGLARMNLLHFSFYTALGAGIWIVILAYIGYWIGDNEVLVKHISKNVGLLLLGVMGLLVYVYIKVHKHRAKAQEAERPDATEDNADEQPPAPSS